MESEEDVEKRGAMENRIVKISHMWDDSDVEWKTWLIPIFVGINVIIFLVTLFINNCPSHGGSRGCVASFLGRFSFEPLHYNPLLGPGPHALMKMGAINWSVIVEHHQRWRLITSIWLHSGLIHILFNMLTLLFIGIRLEQQFGFLRIGIIYLVAGIGGNITSCLFYPSHISVGPTSALLGLIGAMYSELITNWTLYTNKGMAVCTISLMFVINLLLTVVPHPHNGGPLGGFAVGILLGFMLLPRPHIGWFTRRFPSDLGSKTKFKPYQYVLGITSLVLLVIG
uniref:RHOMBOID-like protein n=1 Tax=Chenopodium quinoa TaxID=63459 RepID=A0A803M0H0_CHEQI